MVLTAICLYAVEISALVKANLVIMSFNSTSRSLILVASDFIDKFDPFIVLRRRVGEIETSFPPFLGLVDLSFFKGELAFSLTSDSDASGSFLFLPLNLFFFLAIASSSSFNLSSSAFFFLASISLLNYSSIFFFKRYFLISAFLSSFAFFLPSFIFFLRSFSS
jgi:hypothetical protein